MEEGTKDDEDVPIAVVIDVFLIVGKEIYARRICDSFGKDEDYGKRSDTLANRFDKEEYSPTENDIEYKRELRELMPKEQLVEDADDSYEPDDTE